MGMIKMNKNLILKGLGFAGILLFVTVFASPFTANAYVANAAYKIHEGGQTYGQAAKAPTTSTPKTSCANTLPGITSISPSSANVNSGAKTITIKGTCFTPDSVARFNSSNRTTTYVDANTLKMSLPATDMKVLGKFLVTVHKPNVGFSNSVFFTVKKPTATTTTAKKTNTTNTTNNCEVPVTLATTNDSNNSNLSASAFLSGASFMPKTLLEWVFLWIFILLAIVLWRKLYVTDEKRNAPLKHA